ncbi:hypothetical protein BDV95DRAFT_606677 [Massariosphaeria phaeospora]|uniref:Uncharacterized protein n=1 Tax=Massariosphaeria phaeospora TaxID=100035 RepID=A0A7C8I6R1_9PLEO|nr:hypothetical protein BDV95DRAFT_606677 [Massariosphaeria phaeospora]
MPKHNLRLLALDGDGIHGLSTLQILKQPTAILLSRLRITVDERIDTCVSLSDRIFQKRRHYVTIKGQIQGQSDADGLERTIKDIAVRYSLAENALPKDAPEAKCKV